MSQEEAPDDELNVKSPSPGSPGSPCSPCSPCSPGSSVTYGAAPRLSGDVLDPLSMMAPPPSEEQLGQAADPTSDAAPSTPGHGRAALSSLDAAEMNLKLVAGLDGTGGTGEAACDGGLMMEAGSGESGAKTNEGGNGAAEEEADQEGMAPAIRRVGRLDSTPSIEAVLTGGPTAGIEWLSEETDATSNMMSEKSEVPKPVPSIVLLGLGAAAKDGEAKEAAASAQQSGQPADGAGAQASTEVRIGSKKRATVCLPPTSSPPESPRYSAEFPPSDASVDRSGDGDGDGDEGGEAGGEVEKTESRSASMPTAVVQRKNSATNIQLVSKRRVSRNKTHTVGMDIKPGEKLLTDLGNVPVLRQSRKTTMCEEHGDKAKEKRVEISEPRADDRKPSRKLRRRATALGLDNSTKQGCDFNIIKVNSIRGAIIRMRGGGGTVAELVVQGQSKKKFKGGLGLDCTPKALKENAMKGDVGRVKELITLGVSVNTPHKLLGGGFSSILHSLCLLPTSDVVVQIMEMLLQAFADVNPRCSAGLTPLMCACKSKNARAAQLLLDYAADVSPRDDEGYDCLQWAVVLDASRPEGTDGRTLLEENSPNRRSSTKNRSLGGGLSLSSGASEESSSHCPDPTSSYPMPGMPMFSSMGDRSNLNGERSTGISDIFPSAYTNTNHFEELEIASAEIVDHCIHGRKMWLLHDEDREEEEGPEGKGFDPEKELEAYLKGLPDGQNPFGAYVTSTVSPLLLAIRHTNRRAAEALLTHGAKPEYLHEAVCLGHLGVVNALLEAKANPLGYDHMGESSMDIALRLPDDGGIVDALREAVRTCNMVQDRQSDGPLSPGKGKKEKSALKNRRNSGGMGLGGKGVAEALQITHAASQGSYISTLLSNSKLGWLGGGLRRLKQQSEAVCERCSLEAQWLHAHRVFQTVMFVFLLGALFLPDLWTAIDAQGATVLDVLLIMFLTGFAVEFFVQCVGFHKTYVNTFFFYMDIIGAASLLLDTSYFGDMTGGRSSVGGNAVIMRAARAAKLGARAGRFTRLVKLLRFLPGYQGSVTGFDPKEDAKGWNAAAIIATLSTRVSCLIILLVMILPIFTLLSKPEEDWSMKMWTQHLADAFSQHPNEIPELIADMVACFELRSYRPTSYAWQDGDVVYIQPTRASPFHEIAIEEGKLKVFFDFSQSHRIEAGTNLCLIMFTILLMCTFSLLISNSVTQIAAAPLEGILSRVRVLGSNLNTSVEGMHNHLRGGGGAMGKTGSTRSRRRDGMDAAKGEIDLLERVVQKLATISELTISKEKASESALLYAGQVATTNSIIRATHCADSMRRQSSKEELRLHYSVNGSKEMQSLLSWNFNPLSFSLAKGVDLCMTMLRVSARKLTVYDHSNEEKMNAFVEVASHGYLAGKKYHCWQHAVDVTQAVFCLLHAVSGDSMLMSHLEETALIVAAICHDIGHLGVNNDFLVQTGHELAIRYNDRSPLENMSCARLFEMSQNPDTAVFAPLSQEQYKEVRSICVETILQTDNVHHVPMVKQLQMFAEVNSTVVTGASEGWARSVSLSDDGDPPHRTWPTQELAELLWEAENRQFLRATFLHTADISNPTRTFVTCKEWAKCIIEEFFEQGDAERSLGLPVSPLNDREKTNFPLSQVGFIEFFVAPLVMAAARVLPPLQTDMLENLMVNVRRWAEDWRDETNPTVEELQGIEQRLKRLEDKASAVQPGGRHADALLGPPAPRSGSATPRTLSSNAPLVVSNHRRNSKDRFMGLGVFSQSGSATSSKGGNPSPQRPS
eukprot:TRINITY_DN100467_c0_g1_i1.p1 TRINITY_DN100467_c0_g1~~TRINITY_DN100467_c0_g1_i1.p1  ORF type:complete len:1774 (+),score=431.20 TRINITY_DN100467_c0_g1_i1:236-5557(+)